MIPRYQDIVELLKKGSTLEAQEKIMELREAVIELQDENADLKRNVKELEEKLRFRSSLTFRSPFYFAERDEVPYCPKCWEADKKAIHLLPPVNVVAGMRYDCAQCKSHIVHPRTNR